VSARTIPFETLDTQRRAADPSNSAWVSANAGSGKTHVLAQRVVRLLLEDVPPAKILCLTFTKAAAANMSMRVFDTLSKWTRLGDTDLAAAIEEIGADPGSRRRLVFARRLFARTVETPGGLKIQTIHAFCERLLHLFPFEADVAARFEVIEDIQRSELLERARAVVIARATQDETGVLGESLRLLARETSQSGFDQIIKEALQQRAVLRDALRTLRGSSVYRRALASRLGLRHGETCAEIERAMVEDGIAPSRWSEIACRLGADGTTKASTANKLEWAADEREATAKREAYLGIFLNRDGAPRPDTYLPKSLRKAHPDLCLLLDPERDRLCGLVEKLRAAETVERTTALVALAHSILTEYTRMKSALGLLDFDDLIERTLGLLTNAGAAWVLYKLDSGIDHILVDEAQDTSPQQWEILQKIAEDFTAGFGQREKIRTFFAVGDEKQSIFSFQGAAPHMFEAMRRKFQARVEAAEQSFAPVKLNMSFRSAPGILQLVDEVFAVEANFRGLSADDVKTVHYAWKKDLPALVEIWEPIVAEAREDPRDWRLPLDHIGEQDPPFVLARRIAQTIASWLRPDAAKHVVYDEPERAMRRIRAGDIMILVRTRGPFFEAMIRALKEFDIPVAGADRLALKEHIAVMDLIAAGRTVLLPQDDLTLACVLKSPLVGLDDDDLIALAPQRPASLAAALAASDKPRHRRAAEKLAVWRRWAAELSPFFFYMRLTGPGGGRHDLIARLGFEAADAIDEFLHRALAHDREGPPSLAGFLAEFAAADVSIKRDMETAAEAVRVMTVHAAKGLEAKIVFLPDTCDAPSGRHDPKLFRLDGESGPPLLAWTPRTAADPFVLAEARAARRNAAHEEHRRLLYVAMTRAEERLYICGFRKSETPPTGCWYDSIRKALPEDSFERVAAPWSDEETILRRSSCTAPFQTAAELSPSAPPRRPALPDWLLRPAPTEHAPAPPIRPSSALAAADEFRRRRGSDEVLFDREEALAFGRIVHALLQHLPSVDRERRLAAAERFVAARGRGLDEATRHLLIERALAVIETPELADLFGPRSRAEVAIMGHVRRPDGSYIEIVGQIDRLAETENEIFIADYKSGAPRVAAETPPAYVIQLALYREAVAPLYLGRRMRVFLVWIEAARRGARRADCLIGHLWSACIALPRASMNCIPLSRPWPDAEWLSPPSELDQAGAPAILHDGPEWLR
jgi:ATP-dependent helicase/nuclease subunit A